MLKRLSSLAVLLAAIGFAGIAGTSHAAVTTGMQVLGAAAASDQVIEIGSKKKKKKKSSSGGCPPGQNRGADGVCFSCSHNDVFVNGRCVHKSEANKGGSGCLKGHHIENGVCVPD